MKILVHYPFKLFPQQEKKREKKGKERKRKVKVKIAVPLLNPKTGNLEILLSAHAQTLQANILHLDQKAAKCTTCKWLCGKF